LSQIETTRNYSINHKYLIYCYLKKKACKLNLLWYAFIKTKKINTEVEKMSKEIVKNYFKSSDLQQKKTNLNYRKTVNKELFKSSSRNLDSNISKLINNWNE
jgi:hypothetical protein